jgi:hypothetical protein
MSIFRSWWALCGGWAVDAWIGEQTRDRVDIDIATFAGDRRPDLERHCAIAVGIPTVVPEILLFYKETAYFGDVEMTKRRSHDDVDFETLRD